MSAADRRAMPTAPPSASAEQSGETAATPARDPGNKGIRPTGAAPSGESARSAAVLTARVLDWLDRQKAAPPEATEKERTDREYALGYARGRYNIGLEHYRQVFRELGWSGRQRGLDIGSGAGHWAIAFTFANGRVDGIDRSKVFVDFANGAAAELGVSDRVSHAIGRAEALAFPAESFDVAWSHSVLFYCDIEDAIREIGRVLKTGGGFYCGYSSTGFRINGIYSGVLRAQSTYLMSQLCNYLGASLQRLGMARTPWSAIRCATAEELAAVCGVFGMRLVGRPGLQDGGKDFAGIPATIDLLCVKDDDGEPFRDNLLGVSAATPDGRRRYRELARLGLGKLVCDVLEGRGDALSDPDIRSLYVLAAIRAGRGEAVAMLAHQGIDPLTCGLLAFDCRRIEEAVDSFGELPKEHRERDFLLGSALLAAGQATAAVAAFERGFEAGRRPVECQFGIMLARYGTASWGEQRARMTRALYALPKTLGASHEKVATLARALADAGPTDPS